MMTCENCCVLLDDIFVESKVSTGGIEILNEYYIKCPVCECLIDLREWDIPIPITKELYHV